MTDAIAPRCLCGPCALRSAQPLSCVEQAPPTNETLISLDVQFASSHRTSEMGWTSSVPSFALVYDARMGPHLTLAVFQKHEGWPLWRRLGPFTSPWSCLSHPTLVVGGGGLDLGPCTSPWSCPSHPTLVVGGCFMLARALPPYSHAHIPHLSCCAGFAGLR